MSSEFGYIGIGYDYNNSGTTVTTTGQDLGMSLMYYPGIYMIPGDLSYCSITSVTYTGRTINTPLYYPYTFSGPVGPYASDGAWIILPYFALQLYGPGSTTTKIAYSDLSNGCSYIYHNVSTNPYLLYVSATYFSNAFTINKIRAKYKNDTFYPPNTTYFIRIWYKCVENTLFIATNNRDYTGMSTDNILNSASSIKILS